MEDGMSVSGVQPKIGVMKENDRYVGRTKLQDTHIIAKLPVVGYPLMPELEALSLHLAALAGVTVCEVALEPLEKLVVQHGYDLGDANAATHFLAVTRFDRMPGSRFHVEDFAQIMDVQPEDKYGKSYLQVAAVMLSMPSLGEAAVHELLRRMTVNELLGNPDMHLKNMGVIYKDGTTPTLSPAYDIVGYSAFHRRQGHALYVIPPNLQDKPKVRAQLPGESKTAKPSLTPATLRAFCAQLRLTEKPAAKVIQNVVLAAVRHWPECIAASALTVKQKANLLANFDAHPMVVSIRKRDERQGKDHQG
jgi:serine/threonine-protein kinase HipA